MSRCIGCGDRIPNGWRVCDFCDPLVTDDDPLPMDPEDARLNAMDREAADYAADGWQEDAGDVDEQREGRVTLDSLDILGLVTLGLYAGGCAAYLISYWLMKRAKDRWEREWRENAQP